ncbi:MAG TPA: YihY/virulence factor BrkB family protein, partial [Nitrospiraceae bacterium]|nr:YihY/virulence factor BrkB family protein [Nitrospiraceae bacterium]
MKHGSVLKAVADHRWELVGWTLIIWRALNSFRPGYPLPSAVIRTPQEQGQGPQSARAVHDEPGISANHMSPMKGGLLEVWELIKRTYTKWSEDHAQGLGAALAYYTILSLAPLLIIVIAVAGLVFGQEAAQGQIMGQIQGMVGEESARAIQGMIEAARKPSAGILATMIATVMLLVSATGVFAQLQESLNIIWKVKVKPGG